MKPCWTSTTRIAFTSLPPGSAPFGVPRAQEPGRAAARPGCPQASPLGCAPRPFPLWSRGGGERAEVDDDAANGGGRRVDPLEVHRVDGGDGNGVGARGPARRVRLPLDHEVL